MSGQTTDYQVKLPVFEGPLDLLLYLVQKRELDITAISLAAVADQYLAYIESVEQINPDALVDFLVIAAKLLVLKSFALVPMPNPSPEEEEIAQDLTAALLEYQLYKRAAEELRIREEGGLRSYPRVARPTLNIVPPLEKVQIDELAALLRQIGDRETEEDGHISVPERIFTIAEKIDTIQQHLAERAKVGFGQLLSQAASRLEVVVTFLAVLELLKRGSVEVEQERLFAEIYLLPNVIP